MKGYNLFFILFLGFFVNCHSKTGGGYEKSSVKSPRSFMAIKIAAIVNESIITTYDVEVRGKVLKLLNPGLYNSLTAENMNKEILEQLIREKLLKRQALENNFTIPESDIKSNMELFIKNTKHLSGKTININTLPEDIYLSFYQQIEGEIIFSAIVRSYALDKINFTDEDVARFISSHNQPEGKPITAETAKNMLISLKLSEIEQSFLKNLLENAFIERKGSFYF